MFDPGGTLMRPGRIFLSWAMIAAVSVCHTSPAVAQDNSFRFEITPFTAYRIGGQFDEKEGDRSGERRVGEEGRSRGVADY